MAGNERIRKLRWLCRRGMKELDILLERFISQHQHDLAQGRWPEFESMLQTEDDLLWDWFQTPPASSPYDELLARIRNEPG